MLNKQICQLTAACLSAMTIKHDDHDHEMTTRILLLAYYSNFGRFFNYARRVCCYYF